MNKNKLLRIILCLAVLITVVYLADKYIFPSSDNNVEKLSMSISGLLTLGNLIFIYKNYNLSKTNMEYNKKKQMFDDNANQYYDYLRFLLQVILKYRQNYLSSSNEAILGESIAEPTVDELLKFPSFFLEEDCELKFTGLSSNDAISLKTYISTHKNNLFMLKFYKLINEAELKVQGGEFYFAQNGNTVEYFNNQYKVSQKDYSGNCKNYKFNWQDVENQNYIDLEKKILFYSKTEIEKVQELVNQYSEIKVDLLK